ncbi:hypothetical protein GLOIN_2v1886404 [Rhizophagus clarus]|uniref:Uncharacterized protein n=1 Tax=Rhizophagus clarus TaxID=94130 RepID=A0A8H3QWJ6_9GLOM|nr:hypothetical protein GLOIN_2v1886404 [Rhizophagus clarus]
MRKSHLSLTKPFSLREGTNFSGRNILLRHKSLVRYLVSYYNLQVSLNENFNKEEHFLLIIYLNKHFTYQMFSYFWLQNAHCGKTKVILKMTNS